MIPHVCQFLLVLLNGCNNTTPIFPQITNSSNSNSTYQIQASGCNCSCTNFPNVINLCQMSNVTIPPCATTVSDTSEPISLLPTTPGLTTLPSEEEDDEIFNDQPRKKNTTQKISTTFASTITPNLLTSTVKSTSVLVTDNQMTPNSPDSSNQMKDKLSTQTTIDATELPITPSSPVGFTTNKSPLETIPTFAVSNSSTEKITITERSTSPRPTTRIDSTSSTKNESTSRSSDGTTKSLEEHVNPNDQSSTSQSISTTQPTISSKTSESSISSPTTPKYETSEVSEKNPSTKDNFDNTSTTKSSLTSASYTADTTTTFQASTTDRESITTVHYISSTQKTDEEKVTTPLFTITETSTTFSSNDRSSSSLSDTTGSSTQIEKKEKTQSTTVKYNAPDTPTSITQYDQTPTDLTVTPSVNDITSTTSYKNTLLPIITTEEEEIFNDKASKKITTTKSSTTLEPVELSTTPYSMSRATSDLTTESSDIITTTSSTTDFVSTTQPSNDSNCDLPDQLTDKSMGPMNDTELTSLQRLKHSLFSYGIELSQILLQNDTSNVALSPINFALLLAMVRSGFYSPIKEEFDKILNLTLNATDNRLKLFKSIVESMNNITNNVSVEVYMANKMYLPKDVDVNPRFIELTRNIFQSELQTIDFHDVNSTVKQLNNWSINSTNDRIPVFTDLNRLDPSTSILLASVAYFNGNWSNPFDRQFTSKNLFYLDNGTNKTVCTMIQVNKFRHGELPDLKAEFVELPFENDGNNPLSMIIMVPTNGTSLNTMAERLNKLTYSQLIANSSVKVVELSLPKFRIESIIDLAEDPEKFGLENVTNYSHDFKCIVEVQPLKISHVVQKTVIDVHEGGCWKVPLNYICPKEERSCINTSSIKFVVNQPFIVLVVNSEMVLFSGRVNDPSI